MSVLGAASPGPRGVGGIVERVLGVCWTLTGLYEGKMALPCTSLPPW